MTGGPSRPDAAVTQTDLIAGSHDTRFLCCTRRSVRGAGARPTRELRAASPPSGPQSRSPFRRGQRRLPAVRELAPDVKHESHPPPPCKRRPSHHSAPAGPAPRRPRGTAATPPRGQEKAPGRRGQSPGNAARLLRTRFPAAAPPPPPAGRCGGSLPGCPYRGLADRPRPLLRKRAGREAATLLRPPGPGPPDGAIGHGELSGVPRARPIPRPHLPAPRPLPRRCLLCSSGGGNFPALSWGHRPLGLKLAGDAARRGAERSLGSWQA